jgi:hypothetical protein
MTEVWRPLDARKRLDLFRSLRPARLFLQTFLPTSALIVK